MTTNRLKSHFSYFNYQEPIISIGEKTKNMNYIVRKINLQKIILITVHLRL